MEAVAWKPGAIEGVLTMLQRKNPTAPRGSKMYSRDLAPLHGPRGRGRLGPSLLDFAKENPVQAGLLASSVALPSPAGDAAGFTADVINMVQNPEERTWTNAGLAAAGLVPGIPAIGLTFAGRAAKTADLAALDEAVKMEKRGLRPETIREGTGWLRGPDGKWRFEISDHEARMLTPSEQSAKRAAPDSPPDLTIGDVLHHPALFEAYPDTASIPYNRLSTDPNLVAYYKRQGDEIGLNPANLQKEVPMTQADLDQSTMWGKINQRRADQGLPPLDPSEMKPKLVRADLGGEEELSALVHELSHGVQRREGFARGGAPAEGLRNRILDMVSTNLAELESSAKSLVQRMEASLPDGRVSPGTDEIRDLVAGLDPWASTPHASRIADVARTQFEALNQIEHTRRLERLASKEVIQPRQVFNQSDWYRYSNDVRGKLGPFPRSGKVRRNAYLKAAAEELARLNRNAIPEEYLRFYGDVSDKELKGYVKAAATDLRAAENLERGRQRLKDISDRAMADDINKLYLDLAGEREARKVEERLRLKPDERKKITPFPIGDDPAIILWD